MTALEKPWFQQCMGYQRGDEKVSGIIPPTATIDDELRADFEAEFNSKPRSEKPEEFMLRKWQHHRDAHNEEARRRQGWTGEARSRFIDTAGRHASLVLACKVDESDPTIKAIAEWEADSRMVIAVLAGAPGTGKTTAAAWWSWGCAQDDDEDFGEFANPESLPAWITAAAFARSSRYGDERAELLASRCLVFDDLGVEFLDKNGSLKADIDELVNDFYSARRSRRLVITTNLDATTFEQRYGARVVDRLREVGMWIPCTGQSRRGAS